MAVTYAIIAIVITSAVSLSGIFLLFFKEVAMRRLLFFLVSLSAGALLGDAFFHLLPESAEALPEGFSSTFVLLGILSLFAFEKFLHWHHHHVSEEGGEDLHPVGPMVIFADVLHNVIDGVIIAASFAVSLPVGIATTIAVVLHEIPHEIGNVALLIHAGFEKRKAILINCFSALASFFGAGLFFLVGSLAEYFGYYLLAFAAGSFIYIACSDLVPELHKDIGIKKSLIQLLGITLGILSMAILLFFE